MRGRYIPFVVVACLVWACGEQTPIETLPEAYQDLTVVSPDSLHTASVGDTLLIAVGENSCCMYGWGTDSTITEVFPHSLVVSVIGEFYVPYPEGCDGCSSFTYYALACVAPGTDTLAWYQIPMGDLGSMEMSDTISGSILQNQHPSLFMIRVR